DYFPAVYNQFSNGQSRIDKCNILLQLVQVTEILDALQKVKFAKDSCPLNAKRNCDEAKKRLLDYGQIGSTQIIAGSILANRYQLLRVTVSGGLTVEWKAFDSQRSQPVTLRILPYQLGRNPSHVEQFLRNVRQLKFLRH